MTCARWVGGIAADSARRPPRNASPKPAPATTEPVQYSAGEPSEAEKTMRIVPSASANEPAEAASQAGVRPNASCAAAPEPASANTLSPATMWLPVWNSVAASVGPSDRNSPPIDHDDTTPRAARKNGRRATAGMLGRCGGSRGRRRGGAGAGDPRGPGRGRGEGARRAAPGSGLPSAPANATATSTSSTAYGVTRGAGTPCTRIADTSPPRP